VARWTGFVSGTSAGSCKTATPLFESIVRQQHLPCSCDIATQDRSLILTSSQPVVNVVHPPVTRQNSQFILRNTGLLQTPTVAQLLKKLSASHRTRKCVHEGLPLVPNMGNSHPAHILTGYYPSIYAQITQIFSLFRFLDNDFICI